MIGTQTVQFLHLALALAGKNSRTVCHSTIRWQLIIYPMLHEFSEGSNANLDSLCILTSTGGQIGKGRVWFRTFHALLLTLLSLAGWNKGFGDMKVRNGCPFF
jgi:hypothetical protein